MTDEQIIKDLHACIGDKNDRDCSECSQVDWRVCRDTLMKQALDLINRQKAELERLTKLLDKKCDRCIAKDRAEAIKEFAEKIKRYIADCVSSGYAVEISDEEIDEIAKGMTEEQEDEV